MSWNDMTYSRYRHLISEMKSKCYSMNQESRVSAFQWKKLHTGLVPTYTMYVMCMHMYKWCTSQNIGIFTGKLTPSISGSYYSILICFQMSRHNYAKLLHVIVCDHCMCLVWKRTCTHSNSVCHVYVQGTNVVHTVHVLTLSTQLQAFTDPAVMKTFRRVELCQCSLQSLMMRRGIIIPAVRMKSFSRGGRRYILYIHCTYIVHTIAFLPIHCTYTVHTLHVLYIHCTYIVHTIVFCTYIVHTMYIFSYCDVAVIILRNAGSTDGLQKS